MNLAELEAEVLLLGIWKNVADLEESLSLPELQAIISASRDREHREHTFLAALKGIDLNEGSGNEAQEVFDRAQRKAQAVIRGESLEQTNRRADSDLFGLEFEVEE